MSAWSDYGAEWYRTKREIDPQWYERRVERERQRRRAAGVKPFRTNPLAADIISHVHAGNSWRATAKMLGITVGAVAGVMHRAHLAAALDAPEKETARR